MGKTIWYISKYAVSPNLGNPTRQYFLSKYLSKLGHQITLVFSRSSRIIDPPARVSHAVEFEIDNFKQIMLDGPKVEFGLNLNRILSWIGFEWRLQKWMKTQKSHPEVVIVSSLSILTFLSGMWAKSKFHAKLIIEVRDIYPYTLVATGKFSKSNPLVLILSWIEKKAYKHADYIVSTLPNFDLHLNEIAPSEKSKFVFIPMGYDPDYFIFESLKEQNPIEYPIPRDKFIVAYIGSFGKTQATEVIFDAINKLEHDSSIFFVLAGEGPEKAIGLEKVNNKRNYVDLGYVKKSHIPQILSKCDIALNPWLDLEIYKYGISPNKWMDYMYSEIPFIVCFNGSNSILEEANCSSIIIPENVNALIAEILKFKLLDETSRKAIGKNGKKYLIENLNYKTHAEKIHQLL